MPPGPAFRKDGKDRRNENARVVLRLLSSSFGLPGQSGSDRPRHPARTRVQHLDLKDDQTGTSPSLFLPHSRGIPALEGVGTSRDGTVSQETRPREQKAWPMNKKILQVKKTPRLRLYYLVLPWIVAAMVFVGVQIDQRLARQAAGEMQDHIDETGKHLGDPDPSRISSYQAHDPRSGVRCRRKWRSRQG